MKYNRNIVPKNNLAFKKEGCFFVDKKLKSYKIMVSELLLTYLKRSLKCPILSIEKKKLYIQRLML